MNTIKNIDESECIPSGTPIVNRVLTVAMPWANRKLSPNIHLNFYEKAKTFKSEKWRAVLYTREAMKQAGLTICKPIPTPQSKYRGKKGGTVNIRLILTPPTSRYRDEDNMLAQCKAYIDGIALQLGVNDCVFHYREQIWNEASRKNSSLIFVIDWMEKEEKEH